ncbi:MAG: phage tail protein [Oscillospiraceae bacterium]|nr:phage tail protein [Oscillospiraceae bacterium]
MKFVITNKHRQKIATATHQSGTIAKVAQIALGTGGVNGSGVITPSGGATRLNNEVIRRPYTASQKVNDYCYEYALTLAENECVGQAISEMALIDSAGDLISILNFLPKTKDDIQETYRIRNHYE